MRTYVVPVALAAVVALTGGCSGGDLERRGDPSVRATPEQDVPVVDSEACEEVRTGIETFNRGDYEGTVEHFEAALPLAEDRDDGSRMARELVEAIRYYARLDPQLYPEAARTSTEFAKNKAITLGQCLPVDREDPESPGTDI